MDSAEGEISSGTVRVDLSRCRFGFREAFVKVSIML